jgi:hypothetical protein
MVKIEDIKKILEEEKTPILIHDLANKLNTNWYSIAVLLFRYLVEELNKNPELFKKMPFVIVKKGRFYFIANSNILLKSGNQNA